MLLTDLVKFSRANLADIERIIDGVFLEYELSQNRFSTLDLDSLTGTGLVKYEWDFRA